MKRALLLISITSGLGLAYYLLSVPRPARDPLIIMPLACCFTYPGLLSFNMWLKERFDREVRELRGGK